MTSVRRPEQHELFAIREIRARIVDRAEDDLVVKLFPFGRICVDLLSGHHEIEQLRRGVEDGFGFSLGECRIHSDEYRQASLKL